MGSSSVSRDIPKLVALYQQGDLKLDELVSQRFSLENINEAIASVKRGEALRNLVVF
jgi:Zn-dependent alcohol dehydrogenase